MIKEMYGKPDMKVRYQLYSIMKNNPDYQNQLKKMKSLFNSFNKGGKI